MRTSSSSDDIQSIKVVLVGESGTGKTSIIQKYCNDVFTENTDATLGYADGTKVIHLSNKKQIKLNIWDTAGQEVFRSINKIFYKDTQIVVLVYDVTNQKSFQEIINYWYYETRSHISNDAETIVNENEARQFANENKLLFQLVSAKLNTCIDIFFKEITEKCLSVINTNKDNDDNKYKRAVKLKKSKANKTKKKCC